MPKKFTLEITADIYQYEELSTTEQKLLSRAREASKNAYAPYSNFWVGAAIELESGEIVIGTNQENAAYPSGLCAERTAIYWIGANHPKSKIKSIAVTAQHANSDIFLPVTPCGSCRQAMSEYETKQGEQIKIILEGKDNEVWLIPSIDALLPFKFSEDSLKNQ